MPTITKTRKPPVWLSRHQAADEFGVSVQTIDRRIRAGDLPAFRIGGQVRIKATDLERLARRIPVAAPR